MQTRIYSSAVSGFYRCYYGKLNGADPVAYLRHALNVIAAPPINRVANCCGGPWLISCQPLIPNQQRTQTRHVRFWPDAYVKPNCGKVKIENPKDIER